MKKSILLLALFVSVFVASCTPENLNEEDEQIKLEASDKDEEPDPSGD